tara:strand:+ start:1940 stop:2338 length:399 start_codon:yes stop_codon:yes gene_type:complete
MMYKRDNNDVQEDNNDVQETTMMCKITIQATNDNDNPPQTVRCPSPVRREQKLRPPLLETQQRIDVQTLGSAASAVQTEDGRQVEFPLETAVAVAVVAVPVDVGVVVVVVVVVVVDVVVVVAVVVVAVVAVA